MPRPAVKKTFKLAKAKKLGELSAKIDHENKTFSNKKMLWVSLKNHLGKMLDRTDPLEMIAVIGATYIIKNGIDWTQGFVEGTGEFILGAVAQIGTWLGGTPEEELVKKITETPEGEVIEWVVSFIVAFIIIRHAGALITAGGNILGVAKGLIGGFG